MTGPSYIAIDRLLEAQRKGDARVRALLEQRGPVFLSTGRTWSDEQLLSKLHSLGFAGLDRNQLDELTRAYPSAQKMTEALIATGTIEVPDAERDWVWIGLVCLWERWFPDRPNFEMIDDQMQAGYAALERDELEAAIAEWNHVLLGIEQLFDAFGYASLKEFDEAFRGTQTLFNWVQDFSLELDNEEFTEAHFIRTQLKLAKFVLSKALKTEEDLDLVESFDSDVKACCLQLGLDPRIELREVYASQLDEIVTALDKEYDRRLQAGAMRAAQGCREEITPRLIELIRQAMESVRAGVIPDNNGHFLALMLLFEFKSKAALPTIMEAASLPDDGAYDLFGDALFEYLAGYLAYTAYDELPMIEAFMQNRSADEYVRWTVAGTYGELVRQQRLTRDEASDRLIALLQWACENDEHEIAGPLIDELSSLDVNRGLEVIRRAFQLGLVDRSIINERSVEEAIEGGEDYVQEFLQREPRWDMEDAVAELKSWHSYRDYEEDDLPEDEEDEYDEDEEDDDYVDYSDIYQPAEKLPPASVPVGTIINTTPRVGRNEPCPCGSGKKYKKCCGSRG